MDVSALNQRVPLGDWLRFSEDSSGLAIAQIETPLAAATLCLQGAHLLHWHPHHCALPVLWQAQQVRLVPGKSPHCGAPLCWPWFGAHAHDSSLPSHGFARNVDWTLDAAEIRPDHALALTLSLPETHAYQARWPHRASLQMRIEIGASLAITVSTRNTGTAPITLGEALHTYFRVGDIASARVLGLDGVMYADKIRDFAQDRQRGAITLDGEMDRIYLDTQSACVIEDPLLRRRIIIDKSGSFSTVVWTPGREKGMRLGDLGADGWRTMVCVESANALHNQVVIAPGQAHDFSVQYRVEPL